MLGKTGTLRSLAIMIDLANDNRCFLFNELRFSLAVNKHRKVDCLFVLDELAGHLIGVATNTHQRCSIMTYAKVFDSISGKQ